MTTQIAREGSFYMHHPTDRITHTTAFVTPVVEHWLEQILDIRHMVTLRHGLRETGCHLSGYSNQKTARQPLCVESHGQDRTYHGV